MENVDLDRAKELPQGFYGFSVNDFNPETVSGIVDVFVAATEFQPESVDPEAIHQHVLKLLSPQPTGEPIPVSLLDSGEGIGFGRLEGEELANFNLVVTYFPGSKLNQDYDMHFRNFHAGMKVYLWEKNIKVKVA